MRHARRNKRQTSDEVATGLTKTDFEKVLKKARYCGNRGGGGGVGEGLTFFAACYAETQQTTFQEFRSKYFLGFVYKKTYIFQDQHKKLAKKST